MERAKKGYKFTNKKHTEKGIMSTILGIISLVSVGTAVYQTYLAKGNAGSNMGIVGVMITIFSVTGLVLGYMGKNEQDKFKFFAYLGMILNVAVMACISVILYAGAYGS